MEIYVGGLAKAQLHAHKWKLREVNVDVGKTYKCERCGATAVEAKDEETYRKMLAEGWADPR